MKPGARIKILRILSGLTQERLAELAGLNRSSLVFWERGVYNPSAGAAEALGKVLLCPPGYIMFGTPLPESAAWELTPPKVSRYIAGYYSDIKSLFTDFSAELHIDFVAIYHGDNGHLLFLGNSGGPLRYALFLGHDSYKQICSSLSFLEQKVIEGLKFYPPLTIGFMANETVETFSRYMAFAQNSGVSVDKEALITSLLRSKKIRGDISTEEIKALVENASFHFFLVLQESGILNLPNRSPTKIRSFSNIHDLKVIFSRLYEEVETKSLAWNGEPNVELINFVRRFLTQHGFIPPK